LAQSELVLALEQELGQVPVLVLALEQELEQELELVLLELEQELVLGRRCSAKRVPE
jgi:hypothetical protein